MTDARALAPAARTFPLFCRHRNVIVDTAKPRRNRPAQRRLPLLLRHLVGLAVSAVDGRGVAQLPVGVDNLVGCSGRLRGKHVREELELRRGHAFVLVAARQQLRQSLLKLTVARDELLNQGDNLLALSAVEKRLQHIEHRPFLLGVAAFH